jgi:tetratricopeptide (TPR) repeat protein
MKKILLLIFVFQAFNFCSKGQDFVTYSGDTEKTLIASAQTPDDFLKLALSTELTDIESPLIYNKFMDEYKALNLVAVIADKTPRHIRKVCQMIQERFLKTYSPTAHFGDFILSGEYSDISASVLYAYVFESLQVPYQIVQFPAHVYVIADPGPDAITLQTVDMAKGLFVFNDQAKVENVNEMIKDGYVDQSQAIRLGVERTFDDFFYGKSPLTLKDAISVLYFNKVMGEAQGNENAAYSDICKADMLSPDRRNVFLENRLLLDMANTFKYDKLEEWRALTRLVNSPYAADNIKNFLEFQFDNFLNDKLIRSGQKQLVGDVYNYLHTSIKDTAVKKVIMTDYFLESSQYAYLTSDYEQALSCLEVAYPLSPNNAVIISDFVQMILHKYSSVKFSEQELTDFDKYMDSYPLLKSNPVIVTIYMNYMSVLSMMGFGQNDAATGEKYLQMMVHELEGNPDSNIKNHQIVAKAFSVASIYYFRKPNKQKAIAVLKQGLQYEPDDDELLRKLKADGGN